eukprot:482461_1
MMSHFWSFMITAFSFVNSGNSSKPSTQITINFWQGIDYLNVWQWIEIVWIGICVTICVIISFTSIYQLLIKDSSSWIAKSYRNLTIITIIPFCICAICDFIHMSIRDSKSPNQYPPKSVELKLIGTTHIIFFFGNTMFYTLLLSRIYIAFNLQNWIYYIISTTIFVYGMSCIGYCCLFFILNQNDNKHLFEFYEWEQKITGVLCFVDLTLNLSLFIIFIVKLKQIIGGFQLDIMTAEHMAQMQLITNVIIKHCVLFGIALITNESFFIYILLFATLELKTYIVFFVYAMRGLEIIVNVSVLSLILRINYDKYIILCKCCHILVAKCFLRVADTKHATSNPYYELKEVVEKQEIEQLHEL